MSSPPILLCGWMTFYAILNGMLHVALDRALRRLDPRHVLRTTIPSIIHAMLAVALCGESLLLLLNEPCTKEEDASHCASRTALWTGLLHSAAFFIVDMVPTLVYNANRTRASSFVHHVCCAVTLLAPLAATPQSISGFANTGFWMLLFLVIFEIPNPSMHLNMALKELDWVESPVFLVNEWIFEVGFLVWRLVVGVPASLWLLWDVFSSPESYFTATADGRVVSFGEVMLLGSCLSFIHIFTLLYVSAIGRSMRRKLRGERRTSRRHMKEQRETQLH